MRGNELEHFIEDWDNEAKKTVRLLETLPTTQYDFRPWKNSRSLGELAWHLSEVDAYPPFCVERNDFNFEVRPPGLERPRDVKSLAPGYARVHGEACDRVKRFKIEDLDRSFRYFDGTPMSLRSILWKTTLQHLIHHRGELVLMTRLVGGTPPGMYGPTFEEMAAIREKMSRR